MHKTEIKVRQVEVSACTSSLWLPQINICINTMTAIKRKHNGNIKGVYIYIYSRKSNLSSGGNAGKCG